MSYGVAIGALSPILTPHLIILGDDAVSTYESVCSSQTTGPPPDVKSFHYETISVLKKNYTQATDSPHSLFSSFSCEGLEKYFNALIDARNAITLRRSANGADIGAFLKVLDARLNLYRKDEVFLSSAAHELQQIKQESLKRNFRINFLGLEMFRSLTRNPPHGSSFLELHGATNTCVNTSLRTLEDEQCVTDLFLEDPSSLTEHRIPYFNTLQTSW